MIGSDNVKPAWAGGASSQEHKPPTVALVAHDVHDNGGMERVCSELLRGGRDRFNFVVVSSSLAPELRPLVTRWVPVRVPARPFPLKYLMFWLRAGMVMTRLHVDLIHTVGAIIPKRADVSSVHLCHAGLLEAIGRLAPKSARPMRRLNTAISAIMARNGERWCYRESRLRALAAVSSGVGAELEWHYPSVPVHVIPNGVDGTRFRPDRRAREEVRAGTVPTGGLVALFVGGNWDHKGLAIAIEAVALSRRNGTDVYLWVVGKGDTIRFSALAQRLGVGGVVMFKGARNDVERYFAGADVFVFPSQYESHPLVALEAAASGVPLIGTSVHGVRELINDYGAGLLVARDAYSVSGALDTLERDPALRQKLGNAGRQVSEAYPWEASWNEMITLYYELLRNGSSREAVRP